MRSLGTTAAACMLALASGTFLWGGDTTAEPKALLSVRDVRPAKPQRLPAAAAPLPLDGSLLGVPAGVILVSDIGVTQNKLDAPLDWPEEEPTGAAPGRFEPAPTATVVEPAASESHPSILATDMPQDDAPPRERVAHGAAAPSTEGQWRASAPRDLSEALTKQAPSAKPASPTAASNPADEAMSGDLQPTMESTPPAEAFGDSGETPAAAEANSPAEEAPAEDSEGDFDFLRDEPSADTAQAATVQASNAPATLEASSEATPSDSATATPELTASEFVAFEDSSSDSSGSQTSGADLSCRWDVPEQINLGELATCRMIVQNAGDTPAHAVLVKIELPKNVRLSNADPTPNVSGQAMTWKIPRLEAGQDQQILLSLIPTAEGNIAPTATVTCTRLAQARIAIRKPKLEVTVEGGAQLSLGQPAIYQLAVKNTGSGAAANVQLAARFSDGLQHPQGQQVRYRVGTLAPGETRRVQLPLTGMKPGACQIECFAATGDKLAAESAREIEIVKPMLQVAISGPKLRYVDRKATYMLKVTNPGPAPADNVQVLEQLPEGMRFLEASPGGSFDPNLRQVAWFVGRLEPQQTAEVGVHVVAAEAGDHTLAAVAKADSGVTARVKTMTKVEGVSLVVLDVVDRDDPIEAGSETSYEIRVTNRGSEPAHRVQVAARLPESMSALTAHGPTEGVIEGRQVVFEPIASLAPGQAQTFIVEVKCLEAGAARFQAFFRSDEEPKALLQEETTRIYGE